MSPTTRAPESLYGDRATEATYAECLRRVEDLLFQGGRVIVDASFRADAFRQQYLNAARSLGVRGLWLECRAHSDVCRLRLAARRDDASDADWAEYQEAAGRWELPGPAATAAGHTVDSNGSLAEVIEAALQILRAQELV